MRRFNQQIFCTVALFGFLFFGVAFLMPAFAQPGQGQPSTGMYVPEGNMNWEYARLITLESVMAGGTGRSRMFVVTPDGKRQEEDLKNYYSMTGINFSNVYENEEKKTRLLNDLAKSGWDLYWIETGNQDGIYTTKYLLRRPR
jgi:hypothetical protein